MNLLLKPKVPTQAGWYYWQNDILHKRGCFVEVVEMGGRLSYLCPVQREWVDVGVFRRSQWSDCLEFTVETTPVPPEPKQDDVLTHYLLEILMPEKFKFTIDNP